MRFDAIFADAEHHHIGLFERRTAIAKTTRLLGAAWGIVLGIKIQHDGFAPVVVEGMLLAVVPVEAEMGCLFPFQIGHRAIPPYRSEKAPEAPENSSLTRSARSSGTCAAFIAMDRIVIAIRGRNEALESGALQQRPAHGAACIPSSKARILRRSVSGT